MDHVMQAIGWAEMHWDRGYVTGIGLGPGWDRIRTRLGMQATGCSMGGGGDDLNRENW